MSRYRRLELPQKQPPFLWLAAIAAIVILFTGLSLAVHRVRTNSAILMSQMPMNSKKAPQNDIVATQTMDTLEFKHIASDDLHVTLDGTNNNINVNLPTLIMGGTFQNPSLDINENGLVTRASSEMLQGIESLNGFTDASLSVEAGPNIEISSDLQISMSSNAQFEMLDVLNTTRLGSQTNCSGPVLPSCLNLSGRQCSRPVSSACIPNIVSIDSLDVVNITAKNTVMVQIANQSSLVVENLMSGETYIQENMQCTEEPLDKSCFDFQGFVCDSPADASCFPNDISFDSLQVTNVLSIQNNLVCSTPFDAECIKLDSIVCTSPVHESCIGDRLVLLNGNSGPNVDLVIGPYTVITPIMGGIQITSSAELNTATNVGATGVPVFKQKTGVNFEFRQISTQSDAFTVQEDNLDNIRVHLKMQDIVPGSYQFPIVTISETGLITELDFFSPTDQFGINIGGGTELLKSGTVSLFEFNHVAPGPSGSMETVLVGDTINVDLTDSTVAGLYGNQPENGAPLFTSNQKGKLTSIQNGFIDTGGGSYTISATSGSRSGNVTGGAISRCRLSGPTPAVYGTCPASVFDGSAFTAPESGPYHFYTYTHAVSNLNRPCQGQMAVFRNGVQITTPLGSIPTNRQLNGDRIALTLELAEGDLIYFTITSLSASFICSSVRHFFGFYSLF